jgi:hypothetical protein
MADITVTVSETFSGSYPDIEIDDGIIEQWIEDRLNDARNYFISNMSGGVSAPGDYPGNQTGQLAGSIETEAGGRSGTISANTAYAGYLTDGTRKMAARKMMGDALSESLEENPHTEELAEAVKFV